MKTEVVSFYRCERSGGINKTGLCPQFRIAIFLSICLGFRVFEYIFNSTLCTTCGEHIVHIDGVVGSSPTVTTPSRHREGFFRPFSLSGLFASETGLWRKNTQTPCPPTFSAPDGPHTDQRCGNADRANNSAMRQDSSARILMRHKLFPSPEYVP